MRFDPIVNPLPAGRISTRGNSTVWRMPLRGTHEQRHEATLFESLSFSCASRRSLKRSIDQTWRGLPKRQGNIARGIQEWRCASVMI
jgi:hypothetical protein